ncbi:hypothetical protein V8C43DRAFT_271019 [Trichoderma afarasin]
MWSLCLEWLVVLVDTTTAALHPWPSVAVASPEHTTQPALGSSCESLAVTFLWPSISHTLVVSCVQCHLHFKLFSCRRNANAGQSRGSAPLRHVSHSEALLSLA